jgi:hypothetical protein
VDKLCVICVIIDYIEVESVEYREVSPPYLPFLSSCLGFGEFSGSFTTDVCLKEADRTVSTTENSLSSISYPSGTPAAKIATRQNNEVRSSFFQTTYFIRMKS